MKNYDDFELNCKDDCATCDVKLECEYLTADGEQKQAALAKLAERDEKEAARLAEEKEEAETKETEVAAAKTVEQTEIVEEPTEAVEPTEAAAGSTETEEVAEVIETNSPAEELAEVADEATEQAEEQAEEETAEEVEEEILETAEDTDAPAEVQPTKETAEQTEAPATEEQAKPAEEKAETEEQTTEAVAENATEEQTEQADEKPAKAAFKLTPPENLEELYAAMCTKRARKLIFRPSEAIYDKTFKVLGTDKKNEEGIKVKDILDAEIKQGLKLGYIDKFDGLKTSEIKEEYENDVVYEYAEQEFKKVGVIYDGKKIKVYVYDFDGKACHHVGYIDETEAADVIPYLIDKEKYSFALDGIITGGNAKRVTKDESGKITVTKEKGGAIGLELDITIIPRKD